MLGIIIQLIISWGILWFYEKGNLKALGLVPKKGSALNFLLFFLVTSAICALSYLLKIAFWEQRWTVNTGLSPQIILAGIWWNVKSVLFEELIFRGALFYIAMRQLGPKAAITLSSVIFGVYHWFSKEVFGDPIQMGYWFALTGLFGAVLGYAFVRTRSLYVPVGIHLGWNLTAQLFFSDVPLGNLIFIPVQPQSDITVSYFTYFSVWLFPLAFVPLANYILLKWKLFYK